MTALQLLPTTETVILALEIPIPGMRGFEARLQPIGGEPLRMSSLIEEQPTANGFVVRLQVPAALLEPTDYLLTITAEGPGRSRDVVATRIFSVAR